MERTEEINPEEVRKGDENTSGRRNKWESNPQARAEATPRFLVPTTKAMAKLSLGPIVTADDTIVPWANCDSPSSLIVRRSMEVIKRKERNQSENWDGGRKV